MEAHIYTRGYTTLCTAWKHILTQDNILYKLCGSPASKHTFTQEDIYKLSRSPAWKHTFTREDIQALWKSCMETHIHLGQLALLSLLDMSAAFDTVDHSDCCTPLEPMTGLSFGLSRTLMNAYNPSICQGRRRGHPDRSSVV